MTQPSYRSLALGLAAAASIAWLPSAAGAVDITEVLGFKGTATDIGVQRGVNQIGGIEYRIEGKFVYNGPMNLTNSTITFHRLLDEIEQFDHDEGEILPGNGEMVLTIDNHDLVCVPGDTDCVLEPGFGMPTLVSSKSSKAIEGKYETPARFRPQVRVQIKNKQGVYQFNIRLDRGLSPQVGSPNGNAPDVSCEETEDGERPRPCAFPPERQFPNRCSVDPNNPSGRETTDIRTSFTISDGVNTLDVDFVRPWECSQEGRYHLRSR
jgi:hypothetical protein